jgi:hypothetical protein
MSSPSIRAKSRRFLELAQSPRNKPAGVNLVTQTTTETQRKAGRPRRPPPGPGRPKGSKNKPKIPISPVKRRPMTNRPSPKGKPKRFFWPKIKKGKIEKKTTTTRRQLYENKDPQRIEGNLPSPSYVGLQGNVVPSSPSSLFLSRQQSPSGYLSPPPSPAKKSKAGSQSAIARKEKLLKSRLVTEEQKKQIFYSPGGHGYKLTRISD